MCHIPHILLDRHPTARWAQEFTLLVQILHTFVEQKFRID